MDELHDEDELNLLAHDMDYSADIDWTGWHKMRRLSLKEASALTLNINPDYLDDLEENDSAIAKRQLSDHKKRLRLLTEANDRGTLPTIISNKKTYVDVADLVFWAEDCRIAIPEDLKRYKEHRSRQASIDELSETIKSHEIQIEALQAIMENDNENSKLILYKIIYSMAADKYKYPTKPISNAIHAIKFSYDKFYDKSPDDDTIAKHLKRAADATKPRSKIK